MTKTENFFVKCVEKGIKDEKIEFVPEDVDYKHFYDLCTLNSMNVVVFKALENVREKLSSGFLRALQHTVYSLVMQDAQSEYDINTLLTAFEKHGIRYMPLKGYHLKKLYPSTDMRYASDCDILIDTDQLKDVRMIANELGLKTKRHDEHHDIVYHPETKTVFELHKTIFVGTLEKYFGTGNKGFDRAHKKDGYRHFYEMDKETFYISLLGHSAYHFSEDAGVGIRHLTDIYLYRKAYELDENVLNTELEKCGLLQFKQEFEKLAAYFFDGQEADDFTQKLAEHVLESSLLSNEERKSASTVAAADKESNNKKAQKTALWRKIFLPKEQMQFLFPVLKKAIWLLPIFYILRWGKVIFTRPKAIGQLKKISMVKGDDLSYMREIREGLGINHL